jgi:F1F0 ATPase subunit 2
MNWLGAMAAGGGLGLLYFGGLWLTVRLIVRQSRGTAWFTASQAARFAALGVALSALARAGPGPLLAALVGLWVARSYLVCRLGGFSRGS